MLFWHFASFLPQDVAKRKKPAPHCQRCGTTAQRSSGNTPFIGDNGNWWIGATDTGVKAAGIDGTNGVDGEKGDKGDKGDAGQNGSCSGYFYAEGSTPAWPLQFGSKNISLAEKINKGGLISSTQDGYITLKKGHTYNVIISGSLGVCSGTSDGKGYYCIQMTDSSNNSDFCREITRIKRDGVSVSIPYSTDYHSFNFNRMYDASAEDITLRFLFEQSTYDTYIESFRGTITITALD